MDPEQEVYAKEILKLGMTGLGNSGRFITD